MPNNSIMLRENGINEINNKKEELCQRRFILLIFNLSFIASFGIFYTFLFVLRISITDKQAEKSRGD